MEIPGFTYDAVRNRYFKVNPITRPPKPTAGNVDESERKRIRRGHSWYEMLEKRRVTGHMDIRGMWEGVAHNLSSGSIDDVSSDPRDGQILVNRSGTLLARTETSYFSSHLSCYDIKATHLGVQAELLPGNYEYCMGGISPFCQLSDGLDALYIMLSMDGGFYLTQRILCSNGHVTDNHSSECLQEALPLLISVGYEESMIVAYPKFGLKYYTKFGMPATKMRRQHSKLVSAVDMDKESPLVAIGYNDGEVCVIDTRSISKPMYIGRIPKVDKRISRIVKLHLLSGGTHIITSAMNSKLQLWDIRMNHVVHTFPYFSNSHSRNISTVLDDREAFIAAGCDDSMVRMWSVSSGQLLSSFSAKKSSVCFSDSFGGVTGKPTLIVDEVCGRTGDFSDGVDPDRTFDENCVITYPCSLSDRPTRVPLPLYPSY